MHLTVFVHTLMNEFMSLVFDYWSDPNMEIATYIHSAMVDGVVTDFPATAQVGELQSTVLPTLLPPAEAPLPPLEVANVVDPPLPAVTNVNAPVAPAPAPPPPTPPPPPSGAWANTVNHGLSICKFVLDI